MAAARGSNGRETTVAIIGGGAGGAVAAIHHLERSTRASRVVMIEPREHLGSGVAYSTRHPMHLLNSPAGEMSLFSDRPDDVVEWASSRALDVSQTDFPARSLYGEYVADRLEASRRSAKGRAVVEWVREEATTLRRSRGGDLVVGLSGGGHVVAAGADWHGS